MTDLAESAGRLTARLKVAELPLVAAGLVLGAGLHLAGLATAGDVVWAATTAAMLLPLSAGVLRDLLKSRFGVDVIALMAMAGAIALGEFLAGAVIALMMSGGQALEAFAGRRARSELSGLVSRAPRTVHRYEDSTLVSPALEDVRAGDRLLVKPGEIVPVDGVVARGRAVLDESALTGEARPVERLIGDIVRSGVVNQGRAFDLRAVADAAGSTYARIVRLVDEAQSSRAPMERLADRYSVFFFVLTTVMALAAWVVSGRPERALAVLVVATPCPLILAAPVAIVAGISRAAAHGVVVKGGAVLETLARARVALFDKTGTLTLGRPRIVELRTFGSTAGDELLRLAASLDQVSTHIFAGAVVASARDAGLTLSFPDHVAETPGEGIEGTVDGRRVRIGRARWAAAGAIGPELEELRESASRAGLSNIFVAVDGHPAGAMILADPLRPEAADAVRSLRLSGISEVTLVSGDRAAVAQAAAAEIGADGALAECTPEDKVAAVNDARRRGVTLMVGDGINDAPALAAADVGVALGVRGETASSDAAGAVLLVDRIQGLADALRIARRARSIAIQSIVAGMALSGLAMVVAALGYIPPVGGAFLQEGIDVLVILNALRALGGGPRVPIRPGRSPVVAATGAR